MGGMKRCNHLGTRHSVYCNGFFMVSNEMANLIEWGHFGGILYPNSKEEYGNEVE